MHGVYSIEDDARLPGLSCGHRARYADGNGRKSVDLAVFKGDAGANEDTADVVGLQTAAVTEATLTHCQEQEG